MIPQHSKNGSACRMVVIVGVPGAYTSVTRPKTVQESIWLFRLQTSEKPLNPDRKLVRARALKREFWSPAMLVGSVRQCQMQRGGLQVAHQLNCRGMRFFETRSIPKTTSLIKIHTNMTGLFWFHDWFRWLHMFPQICDWNESKILADFPAEIAMMQALTGTIFIMEPIICTSWIGFNPFQAREQCISWSRNDHPTPRKCEF